MDLWRSGSACDSSLFRDIHKVIRSNRVRFIRRSEARALVYDFLFMVSFYAKISGGAGALQSCCAANLAQLLLQQ